MYSIRVESSGQRVIRFYQPEEELVRATATRLVEQYELYHNVAHNLYHVSQETETYEDIVIGAIFNGK